MSPGEPTSAPGAPERAVESRAPAAASAPTTRSSIVTFARVHAIDAAGSLGRPRGRIIDVDLRLAAGVHAFVGSPEDGTLALCDALTGVRAPIRGKLYVGGREPHRNPRARARTGALTHNASLPDARTLGGAVRLALRARGESGHRFDAVLDPFGLSPLHARSPSSLTLAERRAVEMALALTTQAPRLVVLFEPFADIAIVSLETIRNRMREMATAGAAVVVATSSSVDAQVIADHFYVLQRGRVLAASPDRSSGVVIGAPELLVEIAPSNDVGIRELVSALAGRPEVTGLSWESRGEPRSVHSAGEPSSSQGGVGAALRVRGGDLDACAVVLASAALDAGVTVESITLTAPPPVPTPIALVPTPAMPPPLRAFGAPSAIGPPPASAAPLPGRAGGQGGAP